MIMAILSFGVGVLCGVFGHKWIAAKATAVAPQAVATVESIAKKV